MARNSVTTWANGYGIWHAKVKLGVATPSDGLNSDSLRATARRAIRRELKERDAYSGNYRVRIEVVANELGADNRLYSITYAEKV